LVIKAASYRRIGYANQISLALGLFISVMEILVIDGNHPLASLWYVPGYPPSGEFETASFDNKHGGCVLVLICGCLRCDGY
jgi:hypothetical protein